MQRKITLISAALAAIMFFTTTGLAAGSPNATLRLLERLVPARGDPKLKEINITLTNVGQRAVGDFRLRSFTTQPKYARPISATVTKGRPIYWKRRSVGHGYTVLSSGLASGQSFTLHLWYLNGEVEEGLCVSASAVRLKFMVAYHVPATTKRCWNVKN
ncbi:MAG: hypothetical protein ACREGG_04225 [Candidatus Saccharimonadales bacterium]